ncbi:unnamed protein product [Phytomonas sp. Hart1]|nr:unnamed protein product [Phytomonas sp. Hart1]|eukprot:CCW69954.1 unnamed protein product [Phytomonas sp. isolate Hart1]
MLRKARRDVEGERNPRRRQRVVGILTRVSGVECRQIKRKSAVVNAAGGPNENPHLKWGVPPGVRRGVEAEGATARSFRRCCGLRPAQKCSQTRRQGGQCGDLDVVQEPHGMVRHVKYPQHKGTGDD